LRRRTGAISNGGVSRWGRHQDNRTNKAEFRTVQGQIEFWAKVGRAALDNPDLPASFIAESLMAMNEPREQAEPFVPRTRKPE